MSPCQNVTGIRFPIQALTIVTIVRMSLEISCLFHAPCSMFQNKFSRQNVTGIRFLIQALTINFQSGLVSLKFPKIVFVIFYLKNLGET